LLNESSFLYHYCRGYERYGTIAVSSEIAWGGSVSFRLTLARLNESAGS
jgi:hypothetical protein